jgi:Asp-tRNA(Asn)/Glu-tRNA(Gln) amidotransferase A subunit family amidase
MAPALREDLVLRIAAAYEAMNDWNATRPAAVAAALAQ